ncbi:MAG: NAD(P)-binding domain-containing protein [Myxococcota bacterium]
MFESIEALLIYAPILVLVWWAYTRRGRAESARAVSILESSREANLMQPASLHPVIDPALCLACGACIAACPEDSVLGLVAAKVELISPANCIGHGACKAACPFDAIRLVIGTEERGVDIPVVSETFETNVEGVFVAGELGGMGLIRNGIEQGRQAVDAVARRIERRGRAAASEGSDEILDLVIVGAGPAGLSASLEAKGRGLHVETLEQETIGGTVAHYPRGKIVMTAPVDLPLYGRVQMRETTKEALLRLWTDVIERTGVQIHYGERVERVEAVGRGADRHFLLRSTSYRLRARTVLLAIGRRGTPRKLGVSGEEQSKVVYRLVDPEQYRGRDVLVVGGGDSALEAAWALADVPDVRVTLSYRDRAFTRAKAKNRELVERRRAAGRLRILLDSKVTAIGEDDVEIETATGSIRIDNDAVIVCAGGVVPTDFLKSIGIDIVTKRGEA